MKETAIILKSNLIKRKIKALKLKKMKETIEERIEKLLEEDLKKLEKE